MPTMTTERETPRPRERPLSVCFLGTAVYILVSYSPGVATSTEERAFNVSPTELHQPRTDIASVGARFPNEQHGAAAFPQLTPEPLPPTLPPPQAEAPSPPNYGQKPFARRDSPDVPSPSQPIPAQPELLQPPMPEPAEPGLPPPPMPQPAEPPTLGQGPVPKSPPTTPEQKPTVAAPEPTTLRSNRHH